MRAHLLYVEDDESLSFVARDHLVRPVRLLLLDNTTFVC